MINFLRARRIAVSTLAVAAVTGMATPQALAGFFDYVPTAANYAVLYEGMGGNTLMIESSTIEGNVGVGGTGQVQFNSGAIYGNVDFAAADAGQYSVCPDCGVPASVNYSITAVTTAMGEINALSSMMGGATGTDVAINGDTTINAADGTLDANGNRVFNVTSYSASDANVVNIVGDVAGDSVVLNFAFNSDVNLGGAVVLSGGLSDEQVLWNFNSAGNNVTLNGAQSSDGLTPAFHGIILAPNDAMAMLDANLNGRFWGGDSSTMLIDPSTLQTKTTSVPEPSSVVLLLTAMLAGLGIYRFRTV